MAENDAVAVRVQNVHDGVRLDEGLDLPEDQVPLHLVVRLVGGCVLV